MRKKKIQTKYFGGNKLNNNENWVMLHTKKKKIDNIFHTNWVDKFLLVLI